QLSPEQRAALEQAALAADGKMLPAELQDWLQQLPAEEAEPTAEDALAVVGQWMQWLQESADAAGSRSAPSTQASDPATMLASRAAAGGEAAALAASAEQTGEEGEGELPGRELLGRNPGREQANIESGRQTTQANALQQTTQQSVQQNSQQEFAAALQRAAGSESAATSPAMLGK